VMTGEVVLAAAAGGDPAVARAGDTIGWYATMSGRSLDRAATVRTSGIALRMERDDLFDLLGERPELMRQLFEGMFTVDHAGPVPAAFDPQPAPAPDVQTSRVGPAGPVMSGM